MRKKYIRCVPVTIEALQPDGSWNVRNSFIVANAEVQAGTIDRKELIEEARRVMTQWITNYGHQNSLLRISNGGE